MKVLALCLALAGFPAHAQTLCQPTADMLKTVKGDMGLVPVMVGLEPSGVIVTIYTDPKAEKPEDRTWVAVTTDPKSGISCAPASGRGLVMEQPGSPA